MGLLSLSLAMLPSCTNDELEDQSIFDGRDREAENEFDAWLYTNYVKPYNIDFKYRFEFNESDKGYNLIPASLDKSIAIAKLTKYLWLESYDELCGKNFLKQNCPRIIHIIGSPAFDESGSVVLGAAEGGMKMSLYNVNGINTTKIDIESLNLWYFKTMHHEYAHILHQKKDYPKEFNAVSAQNYQSESWVNLEDQEALDLGFVSKYASSEAQEDFVEILSIYVTNTPDYWDSLVGRASETGREAINAKLSIVRSYFLDTWGFDINSLRDIVQRRSAEVVNLDMTTLKVDSTN